MLSFKEFIQINESAPPDKDIEDWINSVKDSFKKQYGDKWETVLYAAAWKKYNEKNSESVEEQYIAERKIIIRVNSKGQRIKKIKCPKGRVAKKINGRIVCVTPTGRQKFVKRMAIRKALRTKKSKGAGYKKRINLKRNRALKKRRAMGL